MKKSLLVLALATLVLLLPVGAFADTIYSLNVGGTGLGGSAPWGTVTVSLTNANTATVTFTAAGSNVFFDSNAFNFNTLGTLSGYSLNTCDGSPGPTTNAPCISGVLTPSGNVSSFGSFTYGFNMFDGPTDGTQTATFTLTLGGAGWSSDSLVLFKNTPDGFDVAAHVCPGGAGACNNLTGWAGDGSSTSTPEPGSIALLSAGLIGLGGLVRRRKQ